MKLKNPDTDRRHGIMFGLAYGDALGRPTEFMKAARLAKLGSPFRKQVGLNRPSQGIVTDDTQMSIYIGRAAAVPGKPAPAEMAALFVGQLIAWKNDPKSHDGQRAPGATCMSAVSRLKSKPEQWLGATVVDSKGNGANMRVSPLALRTDWTWDEMAGAAQLQAAITHAHPTALAASELTAVAVRLLLDGYARPNEQLLDHLLTYAYDQRERYRAEWLGDLWRLSAVRPALPELPASWSADSSVYLRGNWWDDAAGLLPPVKPQPLRRRAPAAKSPQAFISRGWDEMIGALLSVMAVPRNKQQDPCELAGGGWVAEQALAASLHTLLCFPDDPTNALRRAAFTDGDSDSIASITGALAGAAYGLKAFPSHWIGNLEYRRELEGLTADLTAAARPCR
jgi:ADP-ribosylglycohydrolase